MPPLRILTFNFHEPYICLLARTGFDFEVGLYSSGPLARKWQTRFRPVPKNVSMVDESTWRARLGAGAYDVLIAHNETNAANVFRSTTPAILVCHNRRSFLRTTLADNQDNGPEAYDRLLERLRDRFIFVYISQSKRDDYGIPGPVIPPGLDASEYGGYRGEIREVLRVGNMMRARNLMFDVDLQEAACRDFPNRVVGDDPAIPGATPSRSFDDLLEMYRSRRCYLHVTREAWEDGYNLAMLEAMACGMPVVALTNPTSPLTHGIDGFLEDNAESLRERLAQLLDDPELARGVGQAGRDTVAQKFPLNAFLKRWTAAIEETAKLKETAFAAGQWGLTGESRFHVGGYYQSPRPELAAHVPADAARILDVGCGGGEFGRSLKLRGAKTVVGIEVVERAWEIAKEKLDDAILGNIEDIELPFDDGYFDCIVCGDVLEHMAWPAKALAKLERVLAPDGVIVISIPNARFWQVVEMHANGRWQYEDAGIMDRTHLRFFCAPEIQAMVREAGLEIRRMQPLSMWPADRLPRNPDKTISLHRITIGPISDAEYNDFLVYQYLVIAGKRQAGNLASAEQSLAEGRFEEAFRLAERDETAPPIPRTRIMARALARMGRIDDAVSLYRTLASEDASNPAAHRDYGIALIASGRFSEAEPVLRKALDADPNDDRTLGALGLIHIARDEFEPAIERLTQALDLRLDNVELLERLVDTAQKARQLERAEEYLRRFTMCYPGNIEMGCLFAGILIDLGRFSEASAHIDILEMLAPGDESINALRKAVNESESSGSPPVHGYLPNPPPVHEGS